MGLDIRAVERIKYIDTSPTGKICTIHYIRFSYSSYDKFINLLLKHFKNNEIKTITDAGVEGMIYFNDCEKLENLFKKNKEEVFKIFDENDEKKDLEFYKEQYNHFITIFQICKDRGYIEFG
jgi:hypothetical protein